MSSDSPLGEARTGRRWASWLLHPHARVVLLGLLLVGFAVGVAVYMQVVNRYVHFSVQIDAPEVVEPGALAPVRVHIYRPDSRERLTGRAVWRNDEGRVVGESRLVTGTPSPFELPVPEAPGSSVELTLQVRVDGEEEPREATLRLPVREPPSPAHHGTALGAGRPVGGLPEVGSERLVQPQSAAERARVQRLRVDPANADVVVTIVPETGFPVRFLDNRFLVRLTRRDGTPLQHWQALGRLSSNGQRIEQRFVTDALGLAVLRATPLDIANWWIETTDDAGREVSTQLEVVPGFDGLILRLERPIVANDGPIRLTIDTTLGVERWFYDLLSGERWLATGVGRQLAGHHRVSPPGGRWHTGADPLRYAQLQAYLTPFAGAPQSSVRGLLLRAPDVSDAEAARALIDALSTRELDGDYLRALRRLGLPGADTPTDQVDRLLELLIVRLLPTFRPAPRAYDDTQLQTRALLRETTAFRTRMHWLMGLGLVGLLSWIVGRIVLYTRQTRQRTRLFLAELDDDELTQLDERSLAELRTAVVPLTLAAITITAFFLGVIFMLAAM